MECLKNYIQIKGCDAPAYGYDDNTDGDNDASTDPTEPSELFINVDLPISLEQMDKIADAEQKTFLGVWNEVQDRGIKKFVIRVKAGYKELFGICNLDDDWFCENKEKLAYPLLYFLGSELMTERMFSTRINRFTTIDRSRASELKELFDAEFITHLKDALELIDDGDHEEGGEIYNIIEVLP